MARQTFKFQNMTAKSNTSLPQSEKVVEEPTAVHQEPEEERKVGTLLSQLSQKKEKTPFEFKFIPRNMLKANKRNKASQKHLNEVMESILYDGLEQNISVIYIKSDNEYIIETGHTRVAALDNLIEKYENYVDKESEEYKLYLKNVEPFTRLGYPCKVSDVLEEGISYYIDENDDLSNVPEEVIDSEIRMRNTNRVRRGELTPAEQAEEISRLTKLYQRKNLNRKRQDKINIKKQIAEDLNISERQVTNYKAVGNLIPGLKKAFEDCKITLKEGSSYASLPEEEQELILQMIEQGQKVSKEEVAILKNNNKELEFKLLKNETALSELEEEKRRLEKDKVALQEELKTKSEAAEPIILPDPELPKVKQKLNDKENELQDKQKKLQDKEKKILELQATIDAMKNAPKKAELSPQQSRVMKEDLALKSCLEDVKNAIRKFKIAAESFTQSSSNLSGEDLDMLSVISFPELEKEMEVLRQML